MEQDSWGRDPAVLQMRAVFAEMERILVTFLDRTGISPFDPRLRSIRETARNRFERASARASGSGLTTGTLTALYAACLYHSFETAGIGLPRDLLPEDQALFNLVREVSR